MLKPRSRRLAGSLVGLAGLLLVGSVGQASAASLINVQPVSVALKAIPILASIVAPVPEPSEWVMLLVGFFAIGVAVRRANRVKSVSA